MTERKKKVVLIGAGGHHKSCLEVLVQSRGFSIAGIIDTQAKAGSSVAGIKVIGTDSDIPSYIKKGYHFLLTVGFIKDPSHRIRIFDEVKKLGGGFITVIASTAHVSKNALLGEGSIVMHNAFINADTVIGSNCIINTGAIIEHGSSIGDHCHISTGCVVNGDCNIGRGVFLGSNSVICNRVSVHQLSLVGAGAVVARTISRKGTYVGNPARRIK